MQIVLLPQAIEDLAEILDPLWSRIMGKIQLLKEFPSLGPPLDGPYAGYRALTVGLFRVIYRIVSEELIEIAYAVVQDIHSYEKTHKSLLLLKFAAQSEVQIRKGRVTKHKDVAAYFEKKLRA